LRLDWIFPQVSPAPCNHDYGIKNLLAKARGLCFEGVKMLNSLKQWFKILALLVALVACGLQEPAPTTEETADPKAVATNGLTGVYYDNKDFTGITKTRVDATINSNWKTAAPITGIAATTYSVRWTGQIMPAFSQTYTFYLTSSDGARLMVNGQVLVNDWVDGASRVRSGTVALTANTKYDIRLEYYRNATNASMVKLEWQSTSRARQVVPTGNLFSTGSNTEAALTVVKALPQFSSLGVAVDSVSAFGSLSNTGQSFFFKEQGSNNFYEGIVDANSVLLLIRIINVSGVLTGENVLTGTRTPLGNTVDYLDANGVPIAQQLPIFSEKLKPLLVNKFGASSATMVGRPTTTRNGSVVSGCPDGGCAARWNVFSDAEGTFFKTLGAATLGGISAGCKSPTPIGCAAGSAIGAITAGIAFLPNAFAGYSDAEKALINCMQNGEFVLNPTTGQIDHQTGCPLQMTWAIDSSPQVGIVNGNPNSYKLTITNSASSGLVLRGNFAVSTVSGPGNIYSTASNGFLNINPGASIVVILSGNCTGAGQVIGKITATLVVGKPPSDLSPILNCFEGPKILVNPPSLSFSTSLNSSIPPKSLIIKNDGDEQLDVTSISSQQSWISVTPSSFTGTATIAPKTSSQPVQVTASCGSVAEIRTGTIEITHNATNASSPLQVPVTIQCGRPVISVTPVSLSLVSGTNASASSPVTISNNGDASLIYTVVPSISSQSWLSVFPSSNFAGLAPGSSQSVSVAASCGAIAETRNGTLDISSNDPVNPHVTVSVSLRCYQGVVTTVRFAELYWTSPFGGEVAQPCNISVAGWLIAVDIVSLVSNTNASQYIIPDGGTGAERVVCSPTGVNAPMAIALDKARARTTELLNIWKQHVKSSVTVIGEPRSFNIFIRPNTVGGYIASGGLPAPVLDDGLVFLIDVLTPSP
jgi:hypothetical protein